ncbi:MAG: PD40 domain-containing protein [Chitinophagales bacterium]|nr:PD40 domain-containing protein [Chitinophagales bacterium]
MKNAITLFLMILSLLSFAKKWDYLYINKLIANKEYDKVINHYKEDYYSSSTNAEMAFKIAELYVRKKDYNSALEWYEKEINLLKSSNANLLKLADTYKLTGDYQRALDNYLMYAAETGNVNKVYDDALLCEKLIRSTAYIDNYLIEKYAYNTKEEEFNLSSLRGNMLYVQSLPADKKAATYQNTFYQAVRNYANWEKPVVILNENDLTRDIKNISFTQNGNNIVYSKEYREVINPKSKYISNKKPLEEIYFAEFLGGEIIKPIPFPFNSPNYTLTEPCFNDDGTQLFFVSDRFGGSGNYDIWTSNLENGKWTTPQNLGKLANSKYNESHPFYATVEGKPTLYFSSDRPDGFGGYDIYKVVYENGEWQGVELLDAPINSAYDETSFVFFPLANTAYVASNRDGNSDIYRIRPQNVNLVVDVVDSATNEKLDYAYINLLQKNNKVNETITKSGHAVLPVSINKDYNLIITKEDYRPINVRFSTKNMHSGDSVYYSLKLKQDEDFSIENSVINVSLQNFIVFTGTITDQSTGKTIQPDMRMINLNSNKLKTIEINDSGTFEVKLLTNNNYKIIFNYNGKKITDEITTYGLEHGSVKVKDYLITGVKFKSEENRVYTPKIIPDKFKHYFEEDKEKKIDAIVAQKLNPVVEKPSTNFNYSQPTQKTVVDNQAIETINLDNKKAETTKNTITETKTAINNKVEKVEPIVENTKPTTITTTNNNIENKVEVVENKVENTKPITTTNNTVNNTIENKQEAIIKEKETIVENKVEENNIEKVTTPKYTTTAKEEIKQPVQQQISNNTFTELMLPFDIGSDIPSEEKNVNTIYYKINIGTYKTQFLDVQNLKDLGAIEIYETTGGYIYRLGTYYSKDEALGVLSQLRDNNYYLAFILQYINGNVIGILK